MSNAAEELFDDSAEAPETTQQEETEFEIQAAFDASVGDSQGEDDVKLQMISAGATFKNVTRLYNKFMIGAGLAISKQDRDQIVGETLDALEFNTEDTFANAVATLVDAVQGSNERSASALIRAYAKKNELEVYAKPKGEGAPRNSFVHKYYDWLAANPGASEAEAKSFIFGEDGHEETSLNVKNYEKMHQNVRELCNRIAAA